MRFMMTIQTAEGAPLTFEFLAAIGRLSEQFAAAGIRIEPRILAGGAKGERVRWPGAKTTVTDGPFAESKELFGGLGIVEANGQATRERSPDRTRLAAMARTPRAAGARVGTPPANDRSRA